MGYIAALTSCPSALRCHARAPTSPQPRPPPAVTEAQARKLFLYLLAGTLVIKLILAAALPITGDEAYFVLWGRYPALGYYDHPPMVGWLIALMLKLGNSAFVVRLPAIALSTVISVVIYAVLRGRDRRRALLVSSLWLLFPLNVVNILITTDTPLILFSFLSGIAFYSAVRTGRWSLYAAAGAALGLAFLSKYFAVLLALAYVIFVIVQRRRDLWAGLGLVVLTALPFGLLNLYWNYTHCWDNVLFNAFNRSQGARFSPMHVLVYGVTLLYVFTPPVLFYLARTRARLADTMARQPSERLWAYLLGVPLLLFLAVSFKKEIGLHWVLAFLPFLPFALFQGLDELQLTRTIRFMSVFTLLHLLVVSAVLVSPLEAWRHASFYRSMVLGTRTAQVIDQLKPRLKEFELATDSYATASVLAFNLHRNVTVFGKGSYHARQDDMLTDFRALAGHNFLILSKTPKRAEEYSRYFENARTGTLTQNGATYYLVFGYNFDYPRYRDSVLTAIRDSYYHIPAWLPVGSCYFYDKYFGPKP